MRRPFKGRSAGAGPLPCYDAVVIGAGVGGLTCANLLAEGGLRVLLVEQHYTAGGYCSTFRRQGYTFDAATHFYPLLGNPETITGRLLAKLGVATEWVKMGPVDRFHFPDGSTFTVPADFDEYRRRLDAEFPHEKEALDAFFRSVRQAYFLGLLCYFRWRDPALLEGYRDLTVREVLDLLFKDRKLKLLLTADSPHWGSPPGRTSYVFDSMLRLSYFLGNYYPRGGSQAFADELARRFAERGGHVLLHTEVTAVRVKNGAATGVALRCLHGPARAEREVSAGLVVSNADLLHTLTDLVGPRHVAPEYLDGVRRLRGTYPCFLTYLGVRGVEEEVLRRAHGYYWDGWDADELGTGALKFKVFVPTLYEAAMAPPGCHTVIVQKAVEVDYPGISDWPAHKARLEAFVLDNLEAVVPGLLAKAEVRLSATAATSQRFTRNDRGAMLGWEMSPDQVGAGRPDVVGPLKNLFFVGHWTQPGGGITPVLVSAMRVAELALRGAGRAETGLDLWGRLGQRAAAETAAAPAFAGV